MHHRLVLVSACLIARCSRWLWLLLLLTPTHPPTHPPPPLFFVWPVVVAGKIPARPQIGRSTFLAPKLAGPS
jgi:hypothetical protein